MLPKFLTAFAVLSLVAFGQGAGCDQGSDTAELTINGNGPPCYNNVANVPPMGIANLAVNSSNGPGNGVILLSGTGLCGSVPTPWGGSVDLTGVSIITDGVGGTVSGFDNYANTPMSLSGAYSAAPGTQLGVFQAVVQDPSNPPFFFDNSIAFAVWTDTITTTSYTLGDDDFVNHALNVPIVFYGGTYNSVNVCSNGQVTMNTGSTDFTETTAEFFNGWGSPPNPGVGVMWSDLNRGGTTSGATYDVIENPFNDTVRIEYNNQNHWSSQEPAGNFSCTFGADGCNSVFIDHTGFIPGTTSTDNLIFGVTDGDAGVGTDLNTGGYVTIVPYTTPAANEPESSLAELIPNAAPALPTIQFIGNGNGGFMIL